MSLLRLGFDARFAKVLLRSARSSGFESNPGGAAVIAWLNRTPKYGSYSALSYGSLRSGHGRIIHESYGRSALAIAMLSSICLVSAWALLVLAGSHFGNSLSLDAVTGILCLAVGIGLGVESLSRMFLRRSISVTRSDHDMRVDVRTSWAGLARFSPVSADDVHLFAIEYASLAFNGLWISKSTFQGVVLVAGKHVFVPEMSRFSGLDSDGIGLLSALFRRRPTSLTIVAMPTAVL